MWKPRCFYSSCKLIWWNAPNGTACVSVLSCEDMLEAERVWKWSEQNVAIVLWLPSSQWSLCQVGHTALVWQPAEPCVPGALWARHWTTGLRFSGSLSVQHSTLLDGQYSHSPPLWTLFLLLSSHIPSFLQGEGCSDFWWWLRETTSSVSSVNFTSASR